MVYRVYTEKKPSFDHEARSVRHEIRAMGIDCTNVRLLCRYDVEGVDAELFERCVSTVFSEPPVDRVCRALPETDGRVLIVESLPGQFDQRADSAAQCVQLLSLGQRPTVRSARVYLIEGRVSDGDMDRVRRFLTNPVESRETGDALPETLEMDAPTPPDVPVLEGFRALDGEALDALRRDLGLAMDDGDLLFCQSWAREEGRDPTLTEIRMLDTYWSDHCRHTTFLTGLEDVDIRDEKARKTFEMYLDLRKECGREEKPVTLMDMATLGMRALKKRGLLRRLDESEEINACTVKIDVNTPGGSEKWLLLFKNETHNHPTEIEPFGGAATCIGGAIRDPLSGRAYVYAAMRVTGAGDPFSAPLRGKLPQKRLTRTAAAGYSSYGNQIGLATGQVSEWYHPGYTAKRLEIGAVIGAVPESQVRREVPAPGDRVILLGGRTGRDGCGGATGSSKAHTASSLTACGAEVQKGNAPEERKLQRLFRSADFDRLIKRCNDFGAGGVSVAVGELADGLNIDLDRVPKKYQGLDGTELAISESQERMAVVCAEEDVPRLMALAAGENLEATVIAAVTEEKRLRMSWRGKTIVDIPRSFLNSNGAPKKAAISVQAQSFSSPFKAPEGGLEKELGAFFSDLNNCTQQGLSERFDSTIGAGTVLMPFGGENQLTPIQAMVHKISMEAGDTSTVSMMAWGFDPFLSAQSPYIGGYLSVTEAISRLVASGAREGDYYLTQQEYFPRPGSDPKRWGLPAAALLGSLQAQMDLGVAAIGGKDSMSGSFDDLDVPPTLCTFAVTTGDLSHVRPNVFTRPGDGLYLLLPETDEKGIPLPESQKKVWSTARELLKTGCASACWALGHGGAMEGIVKCALGNMTGADLDPTVPKEALYAWAFGGMLLASRTEVPGARKIGAVTGSGRIARGGDSIALSDVKRMYEAPIEPVFPRRAAQGDGAVSPVPRVDRPIPARRAAFAVPRVLIPVFPGSNCEYDSMKALARAGLKGETLVIRNLSGADIRQSIEEMARRVDESQIIFIPGGFSAGDEPDGSGKFITAFFRSGPVRDAVTRLLDDRGGLMLGICNGFQALIKLGLVPYGRIMDPDEGMPTLTFNTIGRHQSRLVRTRVTNVSSPWLMKANVGDIVTVPISHGEGRFVADGKVMDGLIRGGQIFSRYCGPDGEASMDIEYNPNGSMNAVEGIMSPDGRVLGKMGHSERTGEGLYLNVPGNYSLGLFESAKEYFA